MGITLTKDNCISILLGTVYVSAQGASLEEPSSGNLERVWTGTRVIDGR